MGTAAPEKKTKNEDHKVLANEIGSIVAKTKFVGTASKKIITNLGYPGTLKSGINSFLLSAIIAKKINQGLHCPNFKKDDSIKIKGHSCKLYYQKWNSLSWHCDGSRLEAGCKSESRGYTFSSYYRYRCNICDLDLCDECARYYFD